MKVTGKDLIMKLIVIFLSIPVIIYFIYKLIKSGLQKLDKKYKLQECITMDFVNYNKQKPPLVIPVLELVILVQLQSVSSEKKDLYYKCLSQLILYACFLFSINCIAILLLPFIWLNENSENRMKRIKEFHIYLKKIKRIVRENVNRILRVLK